jgi:hypothetical protein
MGQMSGEARDTRFWAVVLQVSEKQALLEFRGERIGAKLETAVKVGEKLLLEQTRVVDGQVHCKVLHRLPQGEAGTCTPDGFYMFWHPTNRNVMPYLLAAAQEQENAEKTEREKLWRFTLHTGTLGAVTLLAVKNTGHCEITVLVENQQAAAQLAHLREAFSEKNAYTPVIRGIRVVPKENLKRVGSSKGYHVDRLR